VKVGALGIESRSAPDPGETLARSGAVPDACVEVWDMIKTIGFYLGRLVRGQIPPTRSAA
jgi:regulator of sigma E protease